MDIGVYSIRKLRSACRVAVSDLEAMEEETSPEVQVVQLCFEDLIHRPRSTLKELYGSVPGFAEWPLSDRESLLPPETIEYGRSHVKDWDEEKPIDLSVGKGGEWGGTKRSYDRYSSGKSRSDHVHVWKEVIFLAHQILLPLSAGKRATDAELLTRRRRPFPVQAWPFIKYDGMRKVWEEDPSCVKLREISKCSHLWPHMPLNMTQRKMMFATWGNVSIAELDIPNSWISKAMAQKLKKANAMLKQVGADAQAGRQARGLAVMAMRCKDGNSGTRGQVFRETARLANSGHFVVRISIDSDAGASPSGGRARRQGRRGRR